MEGLSKMKYLSSEYEYNRVEGTISIVCFQEISVTDKGEVIVTYF